MLSRAESAAILSRYNKLADAKKNSPMPVQFPDISLSASTREEAGPGLLMGKKVVLQVVQKASPKSSPLSGLNLKVSTSPGSDSKAKSSTSSVFSNSKNSNSPENRLKQCISPLKSREVNTNSGGGSSDSGTSPGMQRLISHVSYGSPTKNNNNTNTDFDTDVTRSISTMRQSQSAGRGNAISMLTRTSINSLKKSKIPAPSCSNLRRSVDSATVPRRSSSSSDGNDNGNRKGNTEFSKTFPDSSRSSSSSILSTSASAASASTSVGTNDTNIKQKLTIAIDDILRRNTTTTTDGSITAKLRISANTSGIKRSNSVSVAVSDEDSGTGRRKARGGSDIDSLSDNDNSQSGSDVSNVSRSSANSVSIKKLVGGNAGNSNDIKGSITASTTASAASDFQAKCKARVLKQKNKIQEIARIQEINNNDNNSNSKNKNKNIHKAIEESMNLLKDIEKRKKRIEIYSINHYLQEIESKRFQDFLSEQRRGISGDDDDDGNGNGNFPDDNVSWCSADSSVMPTPRYRSDKERRYDPSTPVKSSSSSISKNIGGV
jgi:hypothetical protein